MTEHERRAVTRRHAGAAVIAIAIAIVAGAIYMMRPSASGVRVTPVGPRDPASEIRFKLYTHDLRPVEENQKVAISASLTGTYLSFRTDPAFLTAYAVDATGKLIWVVPSRAAAMDDARSAELFSSPRELPFPASLPLRGCALGPLRLFAIVTRVPLTASQVEVLSASERQPSSLRSRFSAVVQEWTVMIVPDDGGT